MKLDITITACKRPEILAITLYSFVSKMLIGHDCRAVINVDPVGTGNSIDTVEACKAVFPNTVYRLAEEANFSKGFKWVWQNKSDAEFVLHLEDDWELMKEVDVHHMVEILRRNPKLALSIFY